VIIFELAWYNLLWHRLNVYNNKLSIYNKCAWVGSGFLHLGTEISTHPNSTQQESNYIYLYTTKFGTSIKIRLNRVRDNESQLYIILCTRHFSGITLIFIRYTQKSRQCKVKYCLGSCSIWHSVPRCRKPHYLHSLSQIYLSKHVYYLGIKIGTHVKHPIIDFDIFTLCYFTVCRPKRTYYKSIICYCTYLTGYL
jgi:hypothetical protein